MFNPLPGKDPNDAHDVIPSAADGYGWVCEDHPERAMGRSAQVRVRRPWRAMSQLQISRTMSLKCPRLPFTPDDESRRRH